MWIIPAPTISSQSAPGSEGSISVSTSPEEMLAQFAWSREKATQPRFWRRVWKMGLFPRLRAGAILPRSTVSHGVELWIASLAETRANQTLSPAKVSAPTMKDGYSTTYSGSSRKCGLRVSSARTYAGILTGNSQPSSRHWKDWVTALRSEYSARKRLGSATGESGCSSWPTASTYPDPKDIELVKSRRLRILKERKNGNGFGLTIAQAVAMWPTMMAADDGHKVIPTSAQAGLIGAVALWETPSVALTEGSRKSRGGKRSGELLLTGQAEGMPQVWPTMTALDRPRTPETLAKSAAYRKAKANQNTVPKYLGEVVQDFSHPFTHQAHPIPDGPALSKLRRFVLRQYRMLNSPKLPSWKRLRVWCDRSLRRKLNPQFVEWMHGWPTGWTDSGNAVTEFQAYVQRSRGELLRLLSIRPTEGSLFD